MDGSSVSHRQVPASDLSNPLPKEAAVDDVSVAALEDHTPQSPPPPPPPPPLLSSIKSCPIQISSPCPSNSESRPPTPHPEAPHKTRIGYSGRELSPCAMFKPEYSKPSTSSPVSAPPPPPPPPPPLLPSATSPRQRKEGQVVRPKTFRTHHFDETSQPGPSGASSSTADYIRAIHRPSGGGDYRQYYETLVARRELQAMIERTRLLLPDALTSHNVNEMSVDQIHSVMEEYRYFYEELLYSTENSIRDLIDMELELEDHSHEVEPTFISGPEVKTECQICFDVISLNKRICCSFPACDSCMSEYVKTTVSEGVVKIECIGEGCSSFMYRDEILARLDVSMKEKYYRFLVDANKDPLMKTCPRCSSIQTISPEIQSQRTKYGLQVFCKECQLVWCFECQAPWHEAIKCRDYKKGDKLVKSWAREQHYGSNNAQRCPKCKIFIERKGGCDHMTCSKCDTSFCYKCGSRYLDLKFFGNHLSRYSPVGCKYNYKPDRPVIRRLVRGSVLGGKLLGGLVLVGLGVAAIGVLIGTSVILLPAIGGYKYHKHRRFRRRLKRQQEMIRERSQRSMLELQRDRHVLRSPREREMTLWDTLMLEDMAPRRLRGTTGEPVSLGVQTGPLEKVDVTVHSPFGLDSVGGSESKGSEVQMNIIDEEGTVTVTTAEITHSPCSGDGSEADVVLHVKTSYPKDAASENKLPTRGKKRAEEGREYFSSRDGHVDGKSGNESQKYDSKQAESGSSVPVNKAENYDNTSKCFQSHRRTLSAGSVRKAAKKQDFGSISRKWKLRNPSFKTATESEPINLDLNPIGSLTDAEDSKHSLDPDLDVESDVLTQSGCFIKLFGKKLNNFQVQSDKEKNVQNKSAGVLTNCPDVVTCALEAEMKIKDGIEKVQEIKDSEVKVTGNDECQGHIPQENITTAL